MDTLDYSGSGLNRGSKVVIAAAGRPRRQLALDIGELPLADGFTAPRLCMPGVAAIEGPQLAASPGQAAEGAASAVPADIERLCAALESSPRDDLPLIVVVDDSDFAARSLANFLWTTFTRSNPAADVHGARPFVHQKHWGCRGPLVIDARIKSHHAPLLVEDAGVARRVDALAARGGPLHGIL